MTKLWVVITSRTKISVEKQTWAWPVWLSNNAGFLRHPLTVLAGWLLGGTITGRTWLANCRVRLFASRGQWAMRLPQPSVRLSTLFTPSSTLLFPSHASSEHVLSPSLLLWLLQASCRQLKLLHFSVFQRC